MNAAQKKTYRELSAEIEGRVPPVSCVGDLSARHLGKRVTIRNLHQPGEDWNAPRVSVSGTLDGIARPGIGVGVWLKLKPNAANLDCPLPLDWPCEVDQ